MTNNDLTGNNAETEQKHEGEHPVEDEKPVFIVRRVFGSQAYIQAFPSSGIIPKESTSNF